MSLSLRQYTKKHTPSTGGIPCYVCTLPAPVRRTVNEALKVGWPPVPHIVRWLRTVKGFTNASNDKLRHHRDAHLGAHRPRKVA